MVKKVLVTRIERIVPIALGVLQEQNKLQIYRIEKLNNVLHSQMLVLHPIKCKYCEFLWYTFIIIKILEEKLAYKYHSTSLSFFIRYFLFFSSHLLQIFEQFSFLIAHFEILKLLISFQLLAIWLVLRPSLMGRSTPRSSNGMGQGLWLVITKNNNNNNNND